MLVVSSCTPPRAVKDVTCSPEQWRWNPHSMKTLFLDRHGNEHQAGDRERLERVMQGMKLLPFGRTFIYAAYENPTGKAGGLYPVAENLPRAFSNLRETSISTPEAEHMIRVSPFHKGGKVNDYQDARKLAVDLGKNRNTDDCHYFAKCDAHEIPLDACVPVANHRNEYLYYVGKCPVPFGEPDYKWERPLVDANVFRLLDYRKDGSINDWYLFEADDFFHAPTPPYSYHGEHDPYWKAQKDFLFASRAIPEVLKLIGFTKNVVLMPQDFHLSASVLALTEQIASGAIESGNTAIGLHNVFDYDLSPGELRLITDRWADNYWLNEWQEPKRHTHLSRMIGLTTSPLIAVSEGFAQEIVDRPAKLPVDHNLSYLMRMHGVTGIPNGVFGKVRTNADIIAATRKAQLGDFQELLDLKLESRDKLLGILSSFVDSQRKQDLQDRGSRVIGHWQEETRGEGIKDLKADIPVFAMMGRFDWNQKGHLLALKAIADHIPKDLEARFIIGAAGLSPDLQGHEMFNQFREVITRSSGKLIFLTSWLQGDLREGLFEGSSWALMPSLYEPFGMIPEWRGSGRDTIATPVIAHNTGGLGEQIKDGIDGLLFSAEGPDSDWQEIIYSTTPYRRMSIPTYNVLANDLGMKIQQAVQIYQDPARYGKMLANQPGALSNNSWLTNIFALVAVINCAGNH